MLKKREKTTLLRIANVQKAAGVLKGFIALGFKNLPAIVAITQHYSPDVTRDDLYKFWNFRKIDAAFVLKMEDILEKLKAE